MKERVTILVPRGGEIVRSDIQITGNEFLYAKSPGTLLQRRLTLHIDELPSVTSAVLKTLPNLHIRWSSASNDKLHEPFSSRLPPGLQAFVGTRSNDSYSSNNEQDLCQLLHRFFSQNIECDSELKSFIRSTSRSQYLGKDHSIRHFFHFLPTLEHFQRSLRQDVCQDRKFCLDHVSALNEASSLDIDLDNSGNTLIISALWPSDPALESASPRIVKFQTEDVVEIGILELHKAEAPEDIRLGGFLTVLGDQEEPCELSDDPIKNFKLIQTAPTLFSFAARHRTVPFNHQSKFVTRFQEPLGLHPKIDIELPARHLKAPSDLCSLNAYFTLPSGLFIDRYQLSDSLFLASQNLVALRDLSGEEDLEAPDWVVDKWGSTALFELTVPRSDKLSQFSNSDMWTATIPMHMRYLAAQDGAAGPNFQRLDIPHPVVFWACETSKDINLKVNPFDRIRLGYDHLFSANTIFHHFTPHDAHRVSQVAVPILGTSSADWIVNGTLISVILGFLWVSWTLLRPIYTKT